MYTKQQELLQSQMNVDTENKSQSNSNKLIERELLDGSPFWLIKTEDQYHIVFGKHKINFEPLKTKQEAIKYIQENHWNITCQICIIMANNQIEENTKNQTT